MVSLEEVDGNAFSVMAYVAKEMRKAGYEDREIQEYRNEAMSGDYTNLVYLSAMKCDEINDRLDGVTIDQDEIAERPDLPAFALVKHYWTLDTALQADLRSKFLR